MEQLQVLKRAVEQKPCRAKGQNCVSNDVTSCHLKQYAHARSTRSGSTVSSKPITTTWRLHTVSGDNIISPGKQLFKIHFNTTELLKLRFKFLI